ncbi:nucleoside 2-deoxyribosyltransferase [Chloroflexota bacterium]
MALDRSSTRPKPFIFVLMPFEQGFNDIYKFGIKGAANEVGAYAERLDEQIFTEGMLDRIFNQISKADVIVADMTGRNPNVFYEVGYAHALGKIVLLVTQDSDDIPFDLKHRQHTVYSGSIDILKTELVTKLRWAVAEARRKQDIGPSELFTIHILDVLIPRSGTTDEIPTVFGTVNNNFFNLSLKVRNDSLETTSAISHVYLFCEQNVAVVPCEYISYPIWQSGVTFNLSYSPSGPETNIRSPLQAFTATPIDAQDGLTNQFRLLSTLPALPPGAVEILNIPFLFIQEISDLDSLYRLRLHSATTYHDFTFRLKIKYEPEKAEEKSSAEKNGKSSTKKKKGEK